MSDDTERITVAVVLAAGQGTRMGAGQNKVLMRLRGMPILVHTLAAFDAVAQCQRLVAEFALAKVAAVIAGGATRHQSEDNALAWLRRRIEAGEIDLVVIHDGARPLVTPDEIAAVISESRATGGALLAAAVAPDETLLLINSDGQALRTWPSDELALAQTPQAFDARKLLAAYDAARADGFEGSDTAASFERAGGRVRVVLGPPSNLKVTTPDDLHRAEAWLESQSKQSR
jgi:2-C-methyl-D-erythritol 4-phosphate cytidylyltransferase